jgi:hypothetical protein
LTRYSGTCNDSVGLGDRDIPGGKAPDRRCRVIGWQKYSGRMCCGRCDGHPRREIGAKIWGLMYMYQDYLQGRIQIDIQATEIDMVQVTRLDNQDSGKWNSHFQVGVAEIEYGQLRNVVGQRLKINGDIWVRCSLISV